MVSTLVLAGFPDILFLWGRITGQYPTTYVPVACLLFWCRFLLSHSVILCARSIFRVCSRWQLSFQCINELSAQKIDHIWCVSKMNSCPVCGSATQWLPLVRLLLKNNLLFHWRAYSYESFCSPMLVDAEPLEQTSLFNAPTWHSVLEMTGTPQLAIVVLCRNMYYTDFQSTGLNCWCFCRSGRKTDSEKHGFILFFLSDKFSQHMD